MAKGNGKLAHGVQRGGTDESAPHSTYEGHDTQIDAKKFRKGNFQAVGSAVPTSSTAYSANQKTGKVFGGTSEGQ